MNNDPYSYTEVIQLDYGEVEVGKVATKIINIRNESCREHMYQVQRDPTTNPLDHVFCFRSYTWILAPEEIFLCEIRYRPLVPFSKNVDYFVITDTIGACTKIIVRGFGIGPKVSCSTTKIFMTCTNKDPEVKRRIKLLNNSKAAATFMLNIDDKYKPFQLDTKCGVINPFSHTYITITFASNIERAYTYYLAILILNQEPIIVELHGFCSSHSSKIFNADDTIFSLKEKHGFKAYIRDKVYNLGNLPPVSLSKHYFNFGQVEVGTDHLIQRIPLAICLTNHTNFVLFVNWERDAHGIFTITPTEIQVLPNQCILFDLAFNPAAENNFFGRELVCSVFIKEKKMSSFPFITSVTAIGHSFPTASNGWIPQYDLPQAVIMPPCVPPCSIYTTFMIKKFGHLPLMFQFVPPLASHFTVKPMLGVIHQNYQIIVVEMMSEPKNEQVYIERWSIYFNGNKKNEAYIDFKGYAEYANVIINGNNTLNFPSVLPGCQQFAQLTMRNVTRHTIKYQFYQLPPQLNLEYINGQIDPNDTLYQECFFSPTEPNVDYDFEVQCILSVIKNEFNVGSKSCINLRVRGRSEEGLLEAVPQELNFGELEYNDSKTLSFNLFNSSSVNIYYKLTCVHLNFPLENLNEDVKIQPISDTVFPGSYTKIMVSITPHTPSYYEFAIQYLARVNFRSNKLIAEQSPIKLCNVYCMCILPTIKVLNICASGCKQIFSINTSKDFLWSVLQINRLNKTLQDIVPGERKIINSKLFPMIVNEGSILIEWTMMNPSKFPATMILKQIKQCSCQPVIKSVGLSRQRIDTNCMHKELCMVHQEKDTLNPQEETIIGMRLNFSICGKTNLSWDLDVGHDRHIILNVLMNCLNATEAQDHFLTTETVKFGQIYLGNKDATNKVLWIYNITDKDLPFSVNICNMHKLNEYYHCKVFSCLTPNGIVKARAPMRIIFRFQPRMFGAYKVSVSIIMGDKVSELILEGEACADSRSVFVGRLIPFLCSCRTKYFPSYFNIDCINIWHLPMHNVFAKMLLIYNDLDCDALGYEWKCPVVPGIMHVDIFPHKGILRPHAVCTLRIRVYTKGCPCRINLDIDCVLFNANQRQEYHRSVIKHRILSKELEGQFVITENGTTMPQPWLKILDKPQEYHKTLSLRCIIYPEEDENLRLNSSAELKVAPRNMIFIDASQSNAVINEKEYFLLTFILEGMIWETVSNRQFHKIVHSYLIPRQNVYYSQFLMNVWDRKRLVKRSYISPPILIIEAILEKMLFTIVHEEFSLKTVHLLYSEDIRHRNYLKMPQKHRRYNIDKYINKAQEEDDVEDQQNLRSKFRVSFVE